MVPEVHVVQLHSLCSQVRLHRVGRLVVLFNRRALLAWQRNVDPGGLRPNRATSTHATATRRNGPPKKAEGGGQATQRGQEGRGGVCLCLSAPPPPWGVLRQATTHTSALAPPWSRTQCKDNLTHNMENPPWLDIYMRKEGRVACGKCPEITGPNSIGSVVLCLALEEHDGA